MAVFNNDSHLLTGESLDFADVCIEQHFDSFAREILQKRLRNVGIFSGGDLWATLDYGYRRAETAQGLREFKAHVSSAKHDDMFRQAVEIERLHVSHRFCSREAGNIRDEGSRSKVEKHAITGDRARPPSLR